MKEKRKYLENYLAKPHVFKTPQLKEEEDFEGFVKNFKNGLEKEMIEKEETKAFFVELEKHMQDLINSRQEPLLYIYE